MRLDIGTTHAKEGSPDLVGVDLNIQDLLAHTEYSARVCADAKHLPFKDGSCESVNSSCGPFCEEEDSAVPLLVAELHRVLAEEGQYVIGTCNTEPCKDLALLVLQSVLDISHIEGKKCW
jgi:ubiquinone/menaquinone biosynthesis C-methylase UbiE